MSISLNIPNIPFFPALYGDASTGKTKVWSVTVKSVENNGVIETSHGYVNGKQVVNQRVVTSGKNAGKKNATTPLEQAISEAQSLWKKKQDAGYKPALSQTSTTSNNNNVNTIVETPVNNEVPLPMLALDYNKAGKNMKFPCFAQRKLDGVRCVAISGRGLFSRNGKATSPHLTHIMNDVNKLPSGTILDGELYSDVLTFQEIVGLVKKATLKDGDAAKIAQIHLCVYDTIQPGTNKARNDILTEIFRVNSFGSLRLLSTATCNSVDDVKQLHGVYVSEGYEGLILRNMDGEYKVGHRSRDLQKYKEFMDDEYTVCAFKEGDGIEKGCVLWICKTKAGQEFAVRPRGTQEERKELFLNGNTYVGKQLTVRFQELTNDGIPRFPVGIAFRDYE